MIAGLRWPLHEENSFYLMIEKLVLDKLFSVAITASMENDCSLKPRNKHKLHDYSERESDIPHEALNVINSSPLSDLIDG